MDVMVRLINILKWFFIIVTTPYLLAISAGRDRDIAYVIGIAFLALMQESIKREASRLDCRWYHVVMFAGDEKAIREVVSALNVQRAARKHSSRGAGGIHGSVPDRLTGDGAQVPNG